MAVAAPQEVADGLHRITLGPGAIASNVYFVRSGPDWFLVDAGWAGSAPAIRRAAAAIFGPHWPPAAILLTHLHPDHSGAAGELARGWRVPAYVHPDELPMARGRYLPEFDMPLDHWVVVPVMRLLPTRTRARIEAAGDITDVARHLGPDGVVPGLPDWQWIATPGHTPGHIAYRRPADGVVVSGDAVCTVDLNSVTGILTGRFRLAGPPWYTTWDRRAARRSIARLAQVDCRLLAPGHGAPLAESPSEALGALADPQRGRAADRRRRLQRLVVPVGNPAADSYRPPPRLYSRLQWLGHALTWLGLSPAYVVTLEVPGRRSGILRRTNLVLAQHEGERYLVSLTGESEWVRNVRAAGGRVVLARGGRRRPVRLVGVPVQDRAPVIRSYVLRAGREPGTRQVRREASAFFGVGPQLTLDEVAAKADRFPVFRVTVSGSDEEAVRELGSEE
jgi:glyoxylase-like metal-dependent hydrolase (beta-lactamase superfamily II)